MPAHGRCGVKANRSRHTRLARLAVASIAVTFGAVGISPAAASTAECQGSVYLCSLRYDEVAYLTSHNAMSIKAEGWKAPNQDVSLAEQLDFGVRALMWDLHYDNSKPLGQRTNEVFLCHALCVIGKRPLLDALTELKAWLDAHPTEVMSIMFETYVEAADVHTAFAAAGLDPYLLDHDPAAPWPTLATVINDGTRLVVFTDSGGGGFPGYLPVWDHAVETPFSAKVASDLSCRYNRGSASNALFILNHFLTDPGPRRDRAVTINANPFLAERVASCGSEHSRPVNFVTLDFVTLGDGAAVVAALNAPPPPPTTTSTTTTTTSTSATSSTTSTTSTTSSTTSVTTPSTTPLTTTTVAGSTTAGTTPPTTTRTTTPDAAAAIASAPIASGGIPAPTRPSAPAAQAIRAAATFTG